ncbi:MAG: M23 family metallopeptidase [Candidatus Omnitrophica bacterium]|nr:M23 family metallopeptidase [Candidatus Omnitrophota bacterium]MBU1922895.1 M23 family metallopeptidase [Candidatus Omnitrophota bacterium]
MKKALVIFSIIVLIFTFISLGLLDKQYFACPIEYKSDIIIRNDNYGDGLFASSRTGRRTHKGLDLLADAGVAVLAAKSGKVISATQNQGMGKYIIIRHADNYISIYGHLSEILVRKNDYLRQGQVIGRVGKTGNARPRDMLPHLHFEIRKNGVPHDPLEYI